MLGKPTILGNPHMGKHVFFFQKTNLLNDCGWIAFREDVEWKILDAISPPISRGEGLIGESNSIMIP